MHGSGEQRSNKNVMSLSLEKRDTVKPVLSLLPDPSFPHSAPPCDARARAERRLRYSQSFCESFDPLNQAQLQILFADKAIAKFKGSSSYLSPTFSSIPQV